MKESATSEYNMESGIKSLLKSYKEEQSFQVLMSSYNDEPSIIEEVPLTKKEIYSILENNICTINDVTSVENNGIMTNCVGIAFDSNAGNIGIINEEEIYSIYVLL